jgi:hypothetical protein
VNGLKADDFRVLKAQQLGFSAEDSLRAKSFRMTAAPRLPVGHRLHKREDLALPSRLIHKVAEHPLTHAEPACRGHTVLKRLNEIVVEHLGFVVTRFTHPLLLGEPTGLIDRIVELAIPIP